MHEFYLGEKKHSMKNSWDELSSDEFIKVSTLLGQYSRRELLLFDLRVRLTLLTLGIDIRRMRIRGNEERFNENIYHLSRHIDFFFRIDYEDKRAFSQLSSEVRELLIHTFPEDLPQAPEIRAASKLKRSIRLDVEFARNMIPELQLGRRKFSGYTFGVIDGIAHTSLSALQFSEAQKIVTQYSQVETDQLLSLLCGILYQEKYTEEVAIDLARQFSPIEHAVKEAILLNFLAITNFIVNRTKYRILFDRPKKGKKEAKYSLGLSDNMYMLSKRGYGDSRQMENAGLFKFFDLLIRELADQVGELKAAKKKLGEIAEALNLTIEQVNDLL